MSLITRGLGGAPSSGGGITAPELAAAFAAYGVSTFNPDVSEVVAAGLSEYTGSTLPKIISILSDTDELSTNGVNVVKINDVPVNGVGTSANPWSP